VGPQRLHVLDAGQRRQPHRLAAGGDHELVVADALAAGQHDQAARGVEPLGNAGEQHDLVVGVPVERPQPRRLGRHVLRERRAVVGPLGPDDRHRPVVPERAQGLAATLRREAGADDQQSRSHAARGCRPPVEATPSGKESLGKACRFPRG
jgi:hypothetical protein